MTRADQFRPRRRGLGTRALPVAGLAVLCVLAISAAPIPAAALEVPDEPLTIAVEDVPTVDDPVGESVGETAEDGPVEGEPGAGEAPDLPPDEPASESGEDVDAGSVPDQD